MTIKGFTIIEDKKGGENLQEVAEVLCRKMLFLFLFFCLNTKESKIQAGSMGN